jgi:hypothetical protein
MPPGRWWGPGAKALGLEQGQLVERGPYDLLSGERKAPDGTQLGRPPGSGQNAADVSQLPEPRPQSVAQEPEPRCQASTGIAHSVGHTPGLQLGSHNGSHAKERQLERGR